MQIIIQGFDFEQMKIEALKRADESKIFWDGEKFLIEVPDMQEENQEPK